VALAKGRILIYLLIIILLGTYLYSGVDYLKRRQEQKMLASQVADVTRTLAQMPLPHRDLESRLEAAEASLAVEQKAFPEQINSTQVIGRLLEKAAASQVKAIPLLTAPWAVEKIGEHDYYVFRLSMSIEGSFSQLLGFLAELEAVVVEDLSIRRVSDPSVEIAAQGTIPVEASLDLAVYTQALPVD